MTPRGLLVFRPLHHDGKTKQLLLSGEPLAGEFWPAGGGEPAHCLMRWMDNDGAQIELIEPPKGWKGELGGPGFTLHGLTTTGKEITLLGAWVNQMELGNRISRLTSSTVAIGALTSPEERWPQILYSTANLSEWRHENGLSHFGPTRRKPRHMRVDFDAPETEVVQVPRATLSFEVKGDTAWAYAPDWSIKTWLDFVVRPNRAKTLDQAHHDFAQPLLAFMHFASDRPDSITREVLWNLDARRRIEVIRQGARVIPRAWRPLPGHYLFQRDDLPDLPRAIRRWWKLHQQVQPSLGLFAEHIAHGNVFSPSRLLTLYTSLEKYARTRFEAKGEFKELRSYGGVPSALTGCTNEALKLLGASRGYFAHAETKGDRYTADQIHENALESTRRASALMQSCLLREIGLRKNARIDLMQRHYANWPIP